MATIYLATKLMTMKLDKTEFEKINYDKISNLQEKHQHDIFLRRVISSQKYRKDCRLCLKPGIINIFDETCALNIVNIIKNILGIEIEKDDGKPQYICESCEDTIRLVAKFKETAECTQWRLQQELEIVAESNTDCDIEVWNKVHGGYLNVKGSNVTRDWICGKCRSTFINKDAFCEHELLPNCQTKLKNYICESCSLQFNTLSQLNNHRKIHTGDLRHVCTLCPYRARTAHALSVHTRLHSGTREFSCAHCSAAFPNASNLASHRRRHLPPAFHCDVCQRGFKFKQSLRNHIASQHTTARPYKCNSCGMTFATSKMMRRHERKIHNRPTLRAGVTPIYFRQQNN